jgi:hypothetical protein
MRNRKNKNLWPHLHMCYDSASLAFTLHTLPSRSGALSPVGPAREVAIVADLLAGIAAVGAAGAAQQVRRLRKRLLEVVARRLASCLDQQKEKENAEN